MNNNLFFYLGLTMMIIHEMDAVRCKEWRIFPGLSWLNDSKGFIVFMIAHIPLFYGLIVGIQRADNSSFIFALDVFFLIHVGLHLLFLSHKKNEFKDAFSWIIIVSAGLFGLLDLLIK